MALIDKLTSIANGFRQSRGITGKLTLDRMAELAAESLGGGYSSGDVVTATSVSLTFGSGYSSISVTYGTSVVNTNGTLSLGDATSISVSSAGALDVVKGKYVSVGGVIYYIPTDASISYSGSGVNKQYSTDKASPVFVIA